MEQDSRLDPDLDEITLSLLVPPARGRRPSSALMEYVRDLRLSDIQALDSPVPLGIRTPQLTRIRNTHHALARALADGISQTEAGYITGYSPSRISILKQDPSFQELVEYYKTQAQAKYLDVHQRLATLGISTLEELQERLEHRPEGFANRELMEMAELCLDRSVTAKAAQPGGAGIAISIKFERPEAAGPLIDQDPDPQPPKGE